MKTPGEIADMLKPWLGNLCEPMPYADTAPLMLRMIADGPAWNRFDYRDPVMRQLSGAHYLLRAADSLNELEDLEPCLLLIGHGKEILREILQDSPLASRKPARQANA
jgi:hypothetical protein